MTTTKSETKEGATTTTTTSETKTERTREVITMPDGTRRTIIRERIIVTDENENEVAAPYTLPCDLNIVSAVWGVTDFTKEAREKYANKQREFKAANEEWGKDGWYGYKKSLVVVYEVCDNYSTVVAREDGGSVSLP